MKLNLVSNFYLTMLIFKQRIAVNLKLAAK